MSKRKKLLLTAVVLLLAAVLILILCLWPRQKEYRIAPANAANFTKLFSDLVEACEDPAGRDTTAIDADLAAIQAVSRQDHAVAQSVAEHWEKVYLDKDYRLYVYGTDDASALADEGVPNSRRHAIVILGYALEDGEMQPELVGRCDAAAALARAFPETILVCSGGATGSNNPMQHTEAGMMKAYLVESCGLEAGRIYTDERAMTTADNAVNTLEILRQNGVQSMTVVTSDYHQRWGQMLYLLVSEIYRQQYGSGVEILGNYCYETDPANPFFAMENRIAAQQMAGILHISMR